MQTIAELPVAEATGRVADIYRAIMTASGTGTPALIIRHFATRPGFLEWVWDAVGAEIERGEVLARALAASRRVEVPELPPLGPGDLARAGVGPDDRAGLAGILANYNRMNPMNFALIATIDRLLAVEEAEEPSTSLPLRKQGAPDACEIPASAGMTGAPRPSSPVLPLPAPAAMGALASDLTDLLARLSDHLPQEGPRLVPTLYRHLALWPDLMRRLGPPILARLEDGSVTRAARAFETELAALVQDVAARSPALPPPPLADRAEMRQTLATILVAIPQMTVIGRSLEAALKGGSGLPLA